ncbi:glutamine synthetase family protein [Nocardiopsis sp. CT-R113]|uniref:Glutamine synthetase family protein n=1 Tax=Nocardiopsis codii TaxID=3065942 RepID=A0ABU7KG36_9ACTN|nr:glutamine synthetase family protein [Nocardiopsis sp. CT-R113]MEE2041199.1 glutamine synthetase family protein [Nocardiopsis sp. CT-R113]
MSPLFGDGLPPLTETLPPSPPPPPFPVPAERLRADAASGAITDVIVALPDLQGRVQGSRVNPRDFAERVLEDGFDACLYLLATDVEMESRPGYATDPWGGGLGDFSIVPDPATLRYLPWDPGTALVLGDARDSGGRPVPVAPRQVLRAQLDRLAERGWHALAGTELEFLVFRDSYQEAFEADYRRLTTATRFNSDYAVPELAEIDPLMRRIRTAMERTGMTVESARGECHPGQYEIVFRYGDALRACDNHVVYKAGARALAAQAGVALTFMAKYDGGEGNSCHVHLSLRDGTGAPVFADDGSGRYGMSETMEHFVAGQLACMRDFALLSAPNVNSFKRLSPQAFAPNTVSWGLDNRTCPVRVVGSGGSARIEFRVPGGDANPYLAVAGIVAAGLYGIDRALPLPEPTAGDASAADLPRLPASLEEAVLAWESSDIARSCFGPDVVRHLAAAGRSELAAFSASVTDFERRRHFERG